MGTFWGFLEREIYLCVKISKITLNNKSKPDIIYFEFAKAFDSVSHDIILMLFNTKTCYSLEKHVNKSEERGEKSVNQLLKVLSNAKTR